MKLTVPDLIDEVRALADRNGHCLHIVIMDGNVEDRHVQFCIDWARKEGCNSCLETGLKLLMMSKTQRYKLYKLS